MPIKNKTETYEKITGTSKNNHYKTGNLLDYDYFSNHCRLIAVDSSNKNEVKNPDLNQQISFIGKLEEDDRATMFFIIEKSDKKNNFWIFKKLCKHHKMKTQKIINLVNDSSNEQSKLATKNGLL